MEIKKMKFTCEGCKLEWDIPLPDDKPTHLLGICSRCLNITVQPLNGDDAFIAGSEFIKDLPIELVLEVITQMFVLVAEREHVREVRARAILN